MANVQFRPKTFSKLDVTAETTQADVDGAFAVLDTSGWAQAPTWDAEAQEVSWIQSPWGGSPTVCAVGGTVVIEHADPLLPPPTSADGNPQVIPFAPGDWDDARVTYV